MLFNKYVLDLKVQTWVFSLDISLDIFAKFLNCDLRLDRYHEVIWFFATFNDQLDAEPDFGLRKRGDVASKGHISEHLAGLDKVTTEI